MPQRTSGPILLSKCGELRGKEGKVLVKLTEQGGGGKVLPPVSQARAFPISSFCLRHWKFMLETHVYTGGFLCARCELSSSPDAEEQKSLTPNSFSLLSSYGFLVEKAEPHLRITDEDLHPLVPELGRMGGLRDQTPSQSSAL